jgi:hypothetical protein
VKKLFALLSLLSVYAVAAHATSTKDFTEITSNDDFKYSHYYMVKVDPVAASIDLLNFDDINQTFPLPAVPYNRDGQYGSWLTDENSCLNTRAKVLARDSSSPVTYLPNGCTVDKGEWNEPYTGRLHTSSRQIQIDHVVPLKNSYMNGGHEWEPAKRCLYANYLGNNFHLLSVDGPENLHKGDTTPAQYMPPNKAFACEYIKDWLTIKTIWSLRITPKEATAIQQVVASNNCDRSQMQVSADFLAEQHKFMEDNKDLCRGTIPGYKPDPATPVNPNPTNPDPAKPDPSNPNPTNPNPAPVTTQPTQPVQPEPTPTPTPILGQN